MNIIVLMKYLYCLINAQSASRRSSSSSSSRRVAVANAATERLHGICLKTSIISLVHQPWDNTSLKQGC